MILQSRKNWANGITVLYFAIGMVEIMAEFFSYKPLIFIFKPLIPLLLMVLYWLCSEKRKGLFFVALSLSLLTNILFIPDDEQMLFFGLITFLIHRILVVYFIISLLRIKDFIPVVIATVPFLLVFFYLFLNTTGIPENSFFILIVQNILISVLGGIAFAHYIMNDNKKNSWLLICGLLFIALQFVVFIEKYYLPHLSPHLFRPLAMGLNVFAFYTFYEFVLTTEKSDDNGTAI
jgi:uncharacterized membrane protein YhhN